MTSVTERVCPPTVDAAAAQSLRSPRTHRISIRVHRSGVSGATVSIGSVRGVNLPVPIVQLDSELPLPAYAHEGDAGLDLYARDGITLAAGGGRGLVATGISIAIPMGYGGFVLPRSGMALKHGISVVNAPGLIDAAYRGEIKVILVNTDPETDYVIERGDRVAQLVIQAVAQVEWQVTDDLDGHDRGGGFGHSGR